MASKLVSFPNPRSCDTLNTPLDALAIEKDNIRDIKVAEKTLSMYFISSLFFFSCLNNQKDNNSGTR